MNKNSFMLEVIFLAREEEFSVPYLWFDKKDSVDWKNNSKN